MLEIPRVTVSGFIGGWVDKAMMRLVDILYYIPLMLFVILIMVFYYRISGIISILALVLNLILMMAVLAGFGAVLTLPGIAALVLTVGMAVDANIIIYERIREELRLNKSVRGAVDAGFREIVFRDIAATAVACGQQEQACHGQYCPKAPGKVAK